MRNTIRYGGAVLLIGAFSPIAISSDIWLAWALGYAGATLAQLWLNLLEFPAEGCER